MASDILILPETKRFEANKQRERRIKVGRKSACKYPFLS